MQVVYTEQALQSLEDIIDYLLEHEVPYNKIVVTRDRILARAESLFLNQLFNFLLELK